MKNKQFVITMLITATIGMSALMLFMFVGIKYFVTHKNISNEVGMVREVAQPKIPFQSVIVGVIEEKIGNELKLFDIEKGQTVKVEVVDSTVIKDERGNTIPQESIKVGEIVEINYEPAKENLLAISKSSQSWIKTKLKNVKIDKTNHEILIGENTYQYNENLLLLDQQGKKVDNIHFVGMYDTIHLVGIGNQVYSLSVLEKQGFIEVNNLPTLKGRLEINRNRQLNIEQIGGPIAINPGTHKVGIYLEGYEPFIKTITVAEGETVLLTPDELEKRYYAIEIQVTNG
ncbi:MAG: PEGA domain-containing protein, partial [Cellulosilyticaceae bacterium]